MDKKTSPKKKRKKERKQALYIGCTQKTHFRPRDIYNESKRTEKGITCKWNSKEARVAILISHKINFKIRN